jgi:hypothetical protein
VTRRQVQVGQSFFDRLDELLPAERTAEGGPSATDFLLHEVPTIVDLLAEDFVGATLPVEDAPPVRVLITSGILVRLVAVYAHLRVDDVIEVIYLDIEQT